MKVMRLGVLFCILLVPTMAWAQPQRTVLKLTACTCGEDSQCYLSGVSVQDGKELDILLNYDVYERLCEKKGDDHLVIGKTYTVTYKKELFQEEGEGEQFEAFGLIAIER
ncbi:MAG: hypothetical protein IKO41_13020 [Lachnospiraceae bacterium]|nr:hypothetical protein [Lachnospiraceae bacterium]